MRNRTETLYSRSSKKELYFVPYTVGNIFKKFVNPSTIESKYVDNFYKDENK